MWKRMWSIDYPKPYFALCVLVNALIATGGSILEDLEKQSNVGLSPTITDMSAEGPRKHLSLSLVGINICHSTTCCLFLPSLLHSKLYKTEQIRVSKSQGLDFPLSRKLPVPINKLYLALERRERMKRPTHYFLLLNL